MLHGDAVGCRSGTRPLAGLPMAQKKSKVRRSMSSKRAGSASAAASSGGAASGAALDDASTALVS
jgi:hypothetical protein